MSNRGYLLGRQAPARELARRLYEAGWTDVASLHEMLATILAESEGHEETVNFNLVTVGSRGVGAQVLEWDSASSAKSPPIGAPFSYDRLPARRLLTVTNPVAGQCRTQDGTLAQLSPLALVVSSVDVGVGQRNLPASAYRTAAEQTLRRFDPNLKECRRLFLQQGIEAWVAHSSGRAMDPRSAGRFAHRAARGIGNFLGERVRLSPVPLLGYWHGEDE